MRLSITLLLLYFAINLCSHPARASVASTEIKVTSSDGAPVDLFGWSVDTDGTTAIAAAINGQAGVAYLFDQATGTELHKLTGSNAFAGAQFEGSAAVDGEFAIVGAPTQGKAWVFDVNSGDELFALTGSDSPPISFFGHSVDVSANRGIVGSRFGDEAYVYDLDTGNEIVKLDPPPGSAGFFGVSVAIDGNLAIVGADNDLSGTGEAYVFDVTTGDLLQTLAASDGAGNDSFGISVDIDGTTALVGARGAAPGGAAYVYDVTTGDELWKLVGHDVVAGDQSGLDVALSGNYAVLGGLRHTHEPGGPGDAGSVYLFDVTTGQQVVELLASDAFGGDAFGVSVGLAGNQLIAASPFHDSGIGQAYLYTIPEPASLTLAAVCLALFLATRRRPSS